MAGNVTLNEIAGQFDVWGGLIEDMELLQQDVNNNFQVREFDEVIFVGAGSSYHLAKAASAAFQFISREGTAAFPSSEVMLFHPYLLKKKRKYVVVFFSRSGETTETLGALDVIQNNYRAATVAISCDPSSTLCDSSDMAFPVKNCIEESNVMTKSFTGMLFVAYMFAAAYSERFASITYLEQLAEEGKSSFEWQRRVIETAAAEAPVDRTTIIGGGPFLGLAREAGLKLDEVAMLRTRACSPLEMRHGPQTSLGESDFVILLHSSSAAPEELSLLSEIKKLGAKTMVLSEKKEPEFDTMADYSVLCGRGVPEHCRGILYMPFMQYLACRIAIDRGLDPDDISGLSRVVAF